MATTVKDLIPLIRDIQSPAEMQRFMDYLNHTTMLSFGSEFVSAKGEYVPMLKIQIESMMPEMFTFCKLDRFSDMIAPGLNSDALSALLQALQNIVTDVQEKLAQAWVKEALELTAKNQRENDENA